MANSIDILHFIPDLRAIGQPQLQAYCDEWLQRPIAREFAVAQIRVNHDLMLHINLELQPIVHGDERVFLPIDELLDYVVDCHFHDADKQRELHIAIRESRKRWGDYEVVVGRVGTLWLICKNPACGVELETDHAATEGQ